MQASLNALDEAEAARYLELAVFPEDVQVPTSVIKQLWRATSGDDSLQVDRLLTRLAARSLLTRGESAAAPHVDRLGPIPAHREGGRGVALSRLQFTSSVSSRR